MACPISCCTLVAVTRAMVTADSAAVSATPAIANPRRNGRSTAERMSTGTMSASVPRSSTTTTP
ncbi:Uncharacterised protein [Mycobacteroides abscessus subsp. abscessus]|nr:Uncharacterised protein [Mycobacteroides abscessus subsp. abscessus]